MAAFCQRFNSGSTSAVSSLFFALLAAVDFAFAGLLFVEAVLAGAVFFETVLADTVFFEAVWVLVLRGPRPADLDCDFDLAACDFAGAIRRADLSSLPLLSALFSFSESRRIFKRFEGEGKISVWSESTKASSHPEIFISEASRGVRAWGSTLTRLRLPEPAVLGSFVSVAESSWSDSWLTFWRLLVEDSASDRSGSGSELSSSSSLST